MLRKLILCLTLLVVNVTSDDIERPHIIFIVADDLGWDDVSLHGSDQIMTPNIDIMGYKGIIFQNYYTDTEGTSSRSALFTGKYAMRLGTQGNSISAGEDRGIPVSERLLPSYLHDLGYATHLIGKWQLGKSRQHYLPTNRGFDTFYGFLDGSVDYYTYNHVKYWNNTAYFGLDLFNNLEPVVNQSGHLTDVLTHQAVRLIRDHDTSVPLYLHISHAAPHVGGGLVNLQTPEDSIAANEHIAHSARRYFAGMVTHLDISIGHIIGALAERDILENALIIFVSDNGASAQNFGSNLPFRGTKGTPWEGGVHCTAIAWHASFTPQIYNGLFHVTDWLPTLVAAAGGNVNNTIDGVNQWNALTKDEEIKRKSILITVDDLNGWIALREGHYKIIIGDVANESNCYGKDLKQLRRPAPEYEITLLNAETAHVFKETLGIYLHIDAELSKRKDLGLLINDSRLPVDQELCIPTKEKGCLYNITEDPKESHDIWLSAPEIVSHMTLRARQVWAQIKPRHQPEFDEKSNPALRDYICLPWLSNDEESPEQLQAIPQFPMKLSISDLKYLVDLNLNTFSESMNAYVKSMSDAFIGSVGGLFSY